MILRLSCLYYLSLAYYFYTFYIFNIAGQKAVLGEKWGEEIAEKGGEGGGIVLVDDEKCLASACSWVSRRSYGV